MKSRWIPAVAVVIPLSLAACSSGGSKPGGAKAAYITRSDVICQDVFAKAKAAGSGTDEATAQKQADVWQDANTRLKALAIPGESVEQARQFVTDTENLSLAYTAAARSIAAGNQAKATTYFGQAATIKKEAAKTAKEYGYVECTTINS